MQVSASDLSNADFLVPILHQVIESETDLFRLTPKVIYRRLADRLNIEPEEITKDPEVKAFVKKQAAAVAKNVQEQRESAGTGGADLQLGQRSVHTVETHTPSAPDGDTGHENGSMEEKLVGAAVSRSASVSASPSAGDEMTGSQKGVTRKRNRSDQSVSDAGSEMKSKAARSSKSKKESPSVKTKSQPKGLEKRKELLKSYVKKMHLGSAPYRNLPKDDDVAYVAELETRLRAKCLELNIACPASGLPDLTHVAKRMKDIDLEEELNSIGLKDWEKTAQEDAIGRRAKRRAGKEVCSEETFVSSSMPSLPNGDSAFHSSLVRDSDSEEEEDLDPTPSSEEEEDLDSYEDSDEEDSDISFDSD